MCLETKPATLTGLEKYLGSGFIKGIGPVTAKRIVAYFGLETLEIIEQGHGDLSDQGICYAPAFFHTEVALARRLAAFASVQVDVDLPRVGRWVDTFTQKREITISTEQRRAVELAASSRLLVLTGGPGCGKTFTTRTIVALWRAMGKSILLAAPTGRAAQRLAELTRVEAKTIHRMLAFDPGSMQFRHDEDHPLETQAFVVDETSMLDLFLAHSLFKAIPPDAQVLLVGDIDQLPSVGPGMVLRDLIASEQIPVVRLTEIFRQAAESHIITNAHRINAGQFPRLTPTPEFAESDCLWLEAAEPELGAEGIVHLVNDYLPKHGIDPVKEVQVLCPTTRGEVGTRQLNMMLQQALNPRVSGKTELARGGSVLRVGDRIIQQVNDYTREVFNGDLGTITRIDLEDQEVVVQFTEREVSHDSPISLNWLWPER